MELVWYFLAGMFAFNSLPHLLPGICGEKHMTPFGKESSAIVNVLWGFINLGVSAIFLSLTPAGIHLPQTISGFVALLVGGLIMSLMDANLFSNPNAKMPWWK
ncbi:MAG: hypothetical protein QW303_05215 [Nitrososphaerota archaeon]